MRTSSDLLLILEEDPASRAALCAMAERLGCDHIEAESADALHQVLEIRRPTLAVLAVDRGDGDCLALMNILAHHDARPATLLVGTVGARVMVSVKRAAEARGLEVLGVVARPLDAAEVEFSHREGSAAYVVEYDGSNQVAGKNEKDVDAKCAVTSKHLQGNMLPFYEVTEDDQSD